eukprot:1883624-Rhodomonas_salina.1
MSHELAHGKAYFVVVFRGVRCRHWYRLLPCAIQNQMLHSEFAAGWGICYRRAQCKGHIHGRGIRGGNAKLVAAQPISVSHTA